MRLTKFLILSALIAIMAMPAALRADNDLSGRWTLYPSMGYNIEQAVEGSGCVYVTCNGRLFSRDNDTDEVYIYSTSNKLSDNDISSIAYNKDSKYLFIAYDNGNIDLLYDDGRVVNMPDVKDAVITSGHGINSVSFANGRIYLATDFGLVVYDEKRHEVVDSGIYNKAVSQAFAMGKHLVLIIDETLFVSPLDAKHYSMSTFTEYRKLWCKNALPADDNTLIYNHDAGVMTARIDFDNQEVSDINLYHGTPVNAGNLQALSDGSFMVYDRNYIYILGENNVISTQKALPEVLAGNAVFSADGLKSLWVSDSDGIGHYDLSADTPVVLIQPFRPSALTVDNAVKLFLSNDGERLYITRRGPARVHPNEDDVDNWNGYQTVNIFYTATGQIKDVTVPSYTATPEVSTELASRQRSTGWKGLVGGPSNVVEDPDVPERWYQGFNGEPFFAFDGNEVIAYFNRINCWGNTAFSGENGARGYQVAIDNYGNLWLGSGHKAWDASAAIKKPTYLVLPAEKRRGDLSTVKPEDFIHLGWPNYMGNRDMCTLFCRKSNVTVVSNGDWADCFLAIDNKGTASFDDDTHVLHTSFVDTDGHTLSIRRVYYMVEDKNGQIWFCSDIGPLVITRATDMLAQSVAFKRPIVPRNDGTNFGDYLLDGVKILGIEVDHSNRKWIATETDGVYLVNEDGTEILRHFTSSNSPLTSNVVNSVKCDANNNKVYMATPNGLYVFDSDSSPAAEDYSDVYAYPNPVRPEYTGWITVAGLKDNSLVKIADIAGNVFYQARSEGGMISWDGCNSAGERVRTGVYYVFASDNADGSSSGVVTKIMVVN